MKKNTKIDPASYRQRTYRALADIDGLVSSAVQVKETDLYILASRDVCDEVKSLVLQYRGQLEDYISRRPDFLASLTPLSCDPLAPKIVQDMISAGKHADVGPMAAVAGAVAEHVGRSLLAEGIDEVVVENGGDIFMYRRKDCVAGLFAGESPLSYTIGVKVAKERMPIGICTSSGTVGHSLSLGKADAVTVLAESTALADAAATRIGNEVKEGSLQRALEFAQTIEGLSGVLVVQDKQLGAWGNVEIVTLG